MIKKLAIILIGLVFTLNAGEFKSHSYSFDNGLPTNLIKSVTRDTLGFLWLATDAGLVRYDGQTFIEINDSLYSSYVKKIVKAPNGDLVVITDMGLSRFTPTVDKPVIRPFLEGRQKLLDGYLNYPKSLHWDKNGALWIGEPRSISRYDGKQLKRYHLDSEYSSNSYITAFHFLELPDERLLAISQTGRLLIYDPEKDRFDPQARTQEDTWSNSTETVLKVSDTRWLLGGRAGIFQLDYVHNRLRSKKITAIRRVQTMAAIPGGKILIGTAGDGVFMMDYQGYTAPVPVAVGDLNVVNDITRTADGNIWLSSDRGATLLYKPVFRQVLSFSNFAIENIATAPDGRVYATDGNTVFEIVPDNGSFAARPVYFYDSKVIVALAVVDNTFYLGHVDGFLTRVKNGQVSSTNVGGFHSIFDLSTDRDKNVWVLMNERKYLLKIAPDGQKTIYDSVRGISSEVSALKQDLRGEIYVCGSDSAYLYSYNREQDRFEDISHPVINANNLRTYDIGIDTDGNIWLASNRGLLRHSQKGLDEIPVGGKNLVKSVSVSPQSGIWLGTDFGMFQYYQDEFVRYGTQNGLRNTTFPFRSIGFLNDRLVVGAFDGVYGQVDDIKRLRRTPRPTVLKTIVNGKEPNFDNPRRVFFPHDVILSFSFAALSYPAEKMVYQVRTLGKDSVWTDLGKETRFLLSDLSPGFYRWQVRAKEPGRLWSTPTTISFEIKEAFYKTWWAFLVYALFIGAILLVLVVLMQERRGHSRAKTALKSTEANLSMVLDAAPVYVFTFDENGWITLSEGSALEDSFPLKSAELLGKNVLDMSRHWPELGEHLNRALQRQSFSCVCPLDKSFFKVWFYPQFDEVGDFKGVIGVALDITESILTQEQLKNAKEQAEAASKSKSQFLANMSHEIRTPMNAVIGMTELALETELDTRQQDYIQTVKTSAEALLKVINEILDFSKIESGNLSLELLDFDLHDMLSQITKVMGAMARDKNVYFKLKRDEHLPQRINADPTRLRQVLLNLASNAIKFTPPDGTVHLKAEVNSVNENTAALTFCVSDTGTGIAEEKQKVIFEAFRQADDSTTRQYGGTGLGLTISAQLVKLMGSELQLKSEPGKGSCFYFSIEVPLAVEIDSAHPKEQEIDHSSSYNAKILLAEDNPINRKLALRLLEKISADVTCVPNGREALQKATEEDFDLVLMDIQMPEMDGLEATRKIREYEKNQEAERHIPIIAMTAHAMKGDRERCLDAGMDDYVTKPIQRKALFDSISSRLSEKKLQLQ